MNNGEAAAFVFPQNLASIVDGLKSARQDWRESYDRHAERRVEFPSRQALTRILRQLGAALFPLRLGPPEVTARNEDAWVEATLESTLSQLCAQIELDVRLGEPEIDIEAMGRRASAILTAFADRLPDIRRALDADVKAGYANDPAARSVDEVLLSYPSLAAIIHHRLAHQLHQLGAPLVARTIAEIAHGQTGIDIHPAARIGTGLFIDHGTGIVIGETAILGDNIRLFQGVTLGGEPAETIAVRGTTSRRHPRIEDDVVIFAGAVILGAVTIGARSRIEGNVWIRQDVPPDSLVAAPLPNIRPLSAIPRSDHSLPLGLAGALSRGH